MNTALKKEDIKPGDKLIASVMGREVKVTVTKVTDAAIITDIGPVPWDKLPSMRRAEETK